MTKLMVKTEGKTKITWQDFGGASEDKGKKPSIDRKREITSESGKKWKVEAKGWKRKIEGKFRKVSKCSSE